MSSPSPSPGYYDPTCDPYTYNPYSYPSAPSSSPPPDPHPAPASEYDHDCDGQYNYSEGRYSSGQAEKPTEPPASAQEMDEQRQREVQEVLEALYDLTNKPNKDQGDLDAIKRHLKKWNDLEGSSGRVPGFMPREFRYLAS